MDIDMDLREAESCLLHFDDFNQGFKISSKHLFFFFYFEL